MKLKCALMPGLAAALTVGCRAAPDTSPVPSPPATETPSSTPAVTGEDLARGLDANLSPEVPYASGALGGSGSTPRTPPSEQAPADSVITGMVLIPISDSLVLPRMMSVDVNQRTLELLGEVNEARRQSGARPLGFDPALVAAAGRYSLELSKRGGITHVSGTPGRQTFRDRIAAEGGRARLAGENLARITALPESLASNVVQAWLRSPGHRRNLLDTRFTRTGIGISLGADGVWYVAQMYATAD